MEGEKTGENFDGQAMTAPAKIAPALHLCSTSPARGFCRASTFRELVLNCSLSRFALARRRTERAKTVANEGETDEAAAARLRARALSCARFRAARSCFALPASGAAPSPSGAFAMSAARSVAAVASASAIFSALLALLQA